MNREIIEKLTESFLNEINVNNSIEDEILKETPKRVAKSWMEMLDGYNIDDKTLYKTFPAANNNLVVVRDIEFASVCEHHLLPFTGLMAIGYIPNDRVLGLSKFARIVNCFARRLQLQEKLVEDIANSILSNLNTTDLFIVAKATHSCMACRGVNQRNSSTLTFFINGKFRNYRENEILELLS